MSEETRAVAQWGGKRPGAGRKRGRGRVNNYVRQLLDSPLPKMRSHNVLDLVNEAELWARLLTSEDERVAMSSLMYLTDRRDGKPTQNIQVASLNLNVTPEQLDRARAIAREIAESMRVPMLGQGERDGASDGDGTSQV